jgi:hypothetical protein
MKPYYYVYKATSEFKKLTIEEAHEKACKLAELSPKDSFEILMVVGITSSSKPKTIWIDGIERN